MLADCFQNAGCHDGRANQDLSAHKQFAVAGPRVGNGFVSSCGCPGLCARIQRFIRKDAELGRSFACKTANIEEQPCGGRKVL